MSTRVPGLTGLQLSAVLLLAASVPLWAILIAELWTAIPDRALHLVQPAAPTVTIVAAIFWIGGHNARRRDRSSDMLVDTVVNLTRPAGRQTGPMRLHRVP